MGATLQAELAEMSRDAKKELAGLLFEELSSDQEGMIRLDGEHGPLYVYRPPVNGRERASRLAGSLTAEERADLFRKSQKKSTGLTLDEVNQLIPEFNEATTSTPESRS